MEIFEKYFGKFGRISKYFKILMFSMPTFTFWYGTNGTCHVILTRHIFFLIIQIIIHSKNRKLQIKLLQSYRKINGRELSQKNKWKRNIWHTSDVTQQVITVASAEVSQPYSL